MTMKVDKQAIELLAANSLMTIKDKEFSLIRTLVYDRFGINLTEQKRSLLVGRLQKLLRETGFSNFKDYYDYLASDQSGKALDALVNRVSTNYSYFYREEAHFDFFTKTALPEWSQRLKNKNVNDLRVWTAGCSTGEEPYMLIILMMEFFGAHYPSWSAGVLATDISDRVLCFAREAVYPADRVAKVPTHLKSKYFRAEGTDLVAVVDRVKKELTIRRFNLMNLAFPFRQKFHMIFCRNVMIYFDKPTRDALVKRFHASLEPGGYFFIGHSETLGREQQLFRYIMPACYQKM